MKYQIEAPGQPIVTGEYLDEAEARSVVRRSGLVEDMSTVKVTPLYAESGLTPKHLERMFRYLQNCCLHSPVWTPVDIDRVLCSVWDSYGGGWRDSAAPDESGNWKDGSESQSYTVARLKDGRFGLLSESEDYTGHGCQCNAATNVYDSLGDLLRLGVDDEEARKAIRRRLAVPGAVVTDSGELEAG